MASFVACFIEIVSVWTKTISPFLKKFNDLLSSRISNNEIDCRCRGISSDQRFTTKILKEGPEY